MNSIFCRSTSLNSATSTSYENRMIINTEEIVIEDFDKSIDNWEIPKINKDQIYKTSKYQLFKTDCTIKTGFQVDKNFLHKDFYAIHNKEKRLWFFERFMDTRKDIQQKFYEFTNKYEIYILFFDWFEIYSFQNIIAKPGERYGLRFCLIIDYLVKFKCSFDVKSCDYKS